MSTIIQHAVDTVAHTDFFHFLYNTFLPYYNRLLIIGNIEQANTCIANAYQLWTQYYINYYSQMYIGSGINNPHWNEPLVIMTRYLWTLKSGTYFILSNPGSHYSVYLLLRLTVTLRQHESNFFHFFRFTGLNGYHELADGSFLDNSYLYICLAYAIYSFLRYYQLNMYRLPDSPFRPDFNGPFTA